MKLNEATYCPDCEEIFKFNRVGCPVCANRHIVMLNLFFNRWQAGKDSDHTEKTRQEASNESIFYL